ncbi:hypothetical protein T4A_974 [Trichinella pseudospiralis]|uniref:Uncharacterized protein n=1 Tax=Trichinella pseudospiralis TaxID=6337 RepID=A0A0V1JSE8_TRIPS|nr:hypothetical protein T4A_974 [Trichinella pseudospiralis]KRZ37902.1 hypothetical protein T4C_4686 [Trichinella pseudospiralis]
MHHFLQTIKKERYLLIFGFKFSIGHLLKAFNSTHLTNASLKIAAAIALTRNIMCDRKLLQLQLETDVDILTQYLDSWNTGWMVVLESLSMYGLIFCSKLVHKDEETAPKLTINQSTNQASKQAFSAFHVDIVELKEEESFPPTYQTNLPTKTISQIKNKYFVY